MSYRGAERGQVIYYERKHWEARIPAKLIRYYKTDQDLQLFNSAVIDLDGLPLRVPIKTIFRKES